MKQHKLIATFSFLMQVYELMQKLNLSAIINASNINSTEHLELVTALNITCDLHHAQTELIPGISNNTAITSVVRQLNDANIKDSCEWLKDVVSRKGGERERVSCIEGSTSVSDICRRWNNIHQFSITNVHNTN